MDGEPSCAGCLTEADCYSIDAEGPVCGTDATDYPSECILGVTACDRGDLSLQKAFDGTCAQGL